MLFRAFCENLRPNAVVVWVITVNQEPSDMGEVRNGPE